MPSSKKYGRGRDGRAYRAAGWRLLPALLTVILLIPTQGVHAAVQNTSGILHLSNTLPGGSTAYSIDYSYPSTIQVGTNLTVAVTLRVTSLTGRIDYIFQYRILADVYIG